MPHNLTDVLAFTSPVAVPSDGDPRNAASVETPFQALANRTAFVNDLVAGSGTGITRLRRVSSLAALKALTPTDHDVAIWDAVGLYEYFAASTATADNVNIITPNSGTGRWFIVHYGMKGLALGLCELDTNTLVPEARLPGFTCRAWGKVTTGSGAATINGGSGNFSVSYADSGQLVITLSSALPSANGIVLVTLWRDDPGGATNMIEDQPRAFMVSTTVARVAYYRTSTNSQVDLNSAGGARVVQFAIFA